MSRLRPPDFARHDMLFSQPLKKILIIQLYVPEEEYL